MRSAVVGFLVAVAAFLAGAWLLGRRSEEQQRVYQQAQTLDQVISSVADLYVDSLSKADLYDLAIRGLLRRINDPYAGFLEGDEFDRHAELTSGTYAGIGIRVEASGGWITVVTPLAGSPAEAAGIQAGDRIVVVNGDPAQGWTPDESVARLRGEPGTFVDLSVARAGVGDLLPFRLERRTVAISSVRHSEVIDSNIGYARLEIVSARSASDLSRTIEDLRAAGADRLVLDLRGNPGGLLTESIEITDLFLDDHSAVVETRTRLRSTSRTYDARHGQGWPDMPVVVLVNEFSASAAEIIAGALQDHDRALVVGVPTFGKGLVQSVFPLGSGHALKLTTGRWYTPLGRSIQRDSTPSPDADGELEAFTTPAGRHIRGGGGVQPDVLYEPLAGTVAEELARVLGPRIQAFRSALREISIEQAGATEVPDAADLAIQGDDALREALNQRGIRLSADEWRTVSPEIQREHRYLLARYRSGEAEEMSLRLRDDDLLRLGLERLRGASTTAELLRLPRD